MFADENKLEPVVIHPDWMSKWAPELTDRKLRDCIVSCDGLRYKIATQLMSEETVFLDSDSTQSDIIELVEKFHRPESLRFIGLMWLAPKLIKCLAAKETRDLFSDITREEVKQISIFSSHISADRISYSPNEDMAENEGLKCLAAWIFNNDDWASARIKLRMPPNSFEMIDELEARIVLLDRVMRHCNATLEVL